MKLSHELEDSHKAKFLGQDSPYVDGKDPVSFKAKLFHFLGEVEAIFGIWVLPLLIAITCFHGWDVATYYIDTRNFTEPLFVVVIMAIAASRPIIIFSEKAPSFFAQFGEPGKNDNCPMLLDSNSISITLQILLNMQP